MPNTKSAKKALRSSLKKKEYNQERKYKIRNALRDLRKVLSSGSSEFQGALSKVYSTFDKAVKGKIIKKGKADRKKSRLAKMVQKMTHTAVE